MTPPPGALDPAALAALADRLIALESETSWLEFKENKAEPNDIGEYISALANSAALDGRPHGYMMWGVADADHALVGTTFQPDSKKIGNEDLFPWLVRGLEPQIDFRFYTFEHRGTPVVILQIPAATQRPVQFLGTEYVRVGSYKKKLKDFQDHARRLWRLFDPEAFENAPAVDHLSVEEVIQLVDYPSYFSLMSAPLPENRALILETLEREGIISHDIARDWSISNWGALLFAADLSKFPSLSRKATRVIQYEGVSRINTIREQVGVHGYASGFQGLVRYVTDLLPTNEVISQSLRSSHSLYPQLALRELIANALVHQDLAISGSGPMIELFDDRIEITNPGVPLVQPERFIDGPPQSRNERLARSMRQMGICEERGSGWDKVTFEVEFNQLPPPLIEVHELHTRVVLFAPRPLSAMEREERLRAMYQHACLRYVSRQPMNNTTVRERFGIAPRNSAQASRLLKEAVEAGLIMVYDPTAGARNIRYVPFWADPERSDFT
ncbi:ATP-binding protein [Kribbella sp. NPDC049227]|uniref:ATP-binding protein n=1 Tax=Kribbella sp. NPDC049227 TaxID=3364113 RepID=UPI00371BC895